MLDSDAAALAAYRSLPEVARYQSWDAPFSEVAAARLIAAANAQAPFAVGGWMQLAVREPGDRASLLGDVYVAIPASTPWAAEVGVTVAPHAQRRGVARDALDAVVGYLLGEAATVGIVHRVAAYVHVDNLASLALFDALGFRREGLLVDGSPDGDGWTDEVVFGITAGEWPSRR